MQIKYYHIPIAFIMLSLVIFVGDIGDRYVYYKNSLLLNYLDVSTKSNRYVELNFTDFKQTKLYIDTLPKLEMVELPKRQAITNNAIIGEALGFLTENVKSQRDLIRNFPFGISNIQDIILNLKSQRIIVPYGGYNNNYLSKEDKLIYSDDLEFSSIIHQTLKSISINDLSQPDIFAKTLAGKLKSHWLEMKKSGDYGEDGLYHGKRGYSQNTLLILSELSAQSNFLNPWNNKWPNRLGNGSLARAWIIGLDSRITNDQAFQLAKSQSYITHSEEDIAIAAGAVASLFNKLITSDQMSKQEIIQYLFSMIKSRVGSGSLALMGVDLGIKLAVKKIDPIIVYNSISGFDYNELLTLLSYSFLYFNSFDEALMNIIHTTGDNDSLSFILGALFGGYNNQSLSPKYLNYVEGSAVDLSN